MPRFVAIITFLLFLLSSGVTYLVLRPQPGPHAGTITDASGATGGGDSGASGTAPADSAPLVQATSADVRLLTVERDAEPPLTLRRATADLWLATRGEGDAARTWPVASERVRSALRLLTEQRYPAAPRSGGAGGSGRDRGDPGGPGTRLRLTLADGRTPTVTFRDERLGGQASAVGVGNPPPVRRLPAELADAFLPENVRAWREPTLLAWPAAGASGITLEAQGAAVELSRAGRSWNVRAPGTSDALPADAEQAQRVLATLSALMLERALDDLAPDDASLGFNTPTATIRVIDAGPEVAALASLAGDPSASGAAPPDAADAQRRPRLVQELVVGGAADAQASKVFVRARAFLADSAGRETARAWGPIVGVASGEGLARLTLDPVAYLSPIATTLAAADVARVEFTPAAGAALVLERGPGGWAQVVSSNAAGRDAATRTPPTPLSAEASASLERFIRALAEAKATRVDEAEAPSAPGDAPGVAPGDAAAAGATIEIGLGPAGAPPAQRVRLRRERLRTDQGERDGVVVLSRHATLRYVDPGAVRALAWALTWTSERAGGG